MPAPRITIFGSCVSRDSLEYADPTGHKLRRYIARQSLISAFDTHGTYKLSLKGISSDFQRRMARGDLKSRFANALPRIAKDSDLLLIDLTDERLGFYEMPGGTIVTRTVDLIAAGIDEELQRTGRYVPFGTMEHYRRWTHALAEFDKSLDSLHMRNKVRLLALPWAKKDNLGNPIKYTATVPIRRANLIYSQYYRAAMKVIPTITPSKDVEIRGSHDHRWGLAPFHYTDSVYQYVLSRLGLKPRI